MVCVVKSMSCHAATTQDRKQNRNGKGCSTAKEDEATRSITPSRSELKKDGSVSYPDHNILTNTKKENEIQKTSVGPKTLFSSKASIFPFNHNESNLDPYRIMPDLDSIVRDIGPYKNFIQIERNSLDVRRLSECLPMAGKLRCLLIFSGHDDYSDTDSSNFRICNVDLTFLTYKQKLAFWINIYNACIMHGFLEHGLPSSQENLLATMNKAAVNVGGIVLNALAIEHFILRHPREPNNGHADEKEMLLRHAYGLGYPEPNVTFALCRGSWSSPALRIYTPEEVVNELGRAKVEYLEASVGVTCKRKIVVPKILQWHMRDFADDMESLLEWIYSQLPRSGSLKRLMMECLNGESKFPLTKTVEVQPYESEFRYLLPF
ncbi:WAP four-disulfide core domain protein [Salix suchowensis]|nr:WAP four-disulfide core domain protein [Salix suchowensis]